ncbi:insulin receptor substrate 4-like [Branchiostoma floridae]|uniref:Insulin receptor substrate 4-like n=1 Tax=Branchiostoma floridae TaxID=7739 RepID=A0A9J7NDP3_BRAFL|nr:insulin receptor substrate 4-like [Branchiostoma floridae]
MGDIGDYYGSGRLGFDSGRPDFDNGGRDLDSGEQYFDNGGLRFNNGGREFGNGGQEFDNGGQGFDSGGQGFDSAGRGFDSGGRGFDSGGQGYDSGGRGFDSSGRGFDRGGQAFESVWRDFDGGKRGYDGGGPGYDSGGRGYNSGGRNFDSDEGFVNPSSRTTPVNLHPAYNNRTQTNTVGRDVIFLCMFTGLLLLIPGFLLTILGHRHGYNGLWAAGPVCLCLSLLFFSRGSFCLCKQPKKATYETELWTMQTATPRGPLSDEHGTAHTDMMYPTPVIEPPTEPTAQAMVEERSPIPKQQYRQYPPYP